MSSQLPRLASRQLRLSNKLQSKANPCLICQYTSSAARRTQPRRATPRASGTRLTGRCASTISTSAIEAQPIAPVIEHVEVSERKPLTAAQATAELRQALLDLQKDAGSYTNISRLQLALRSVEAHEETGHETIRVAVVALSGQGHSGAKARELVRLLLADPLTGGMEWEHILTRHKGPILLRIGQHIGEAVEGQNRLIKELNISSPTLNGHHLEILVLDGEVLGNGKVEETVEDVADRLLTPIIDIPVSSTGRYSPITTPVHKTLIIGDGILGGATLLRLSSELDRTQIASAVDIPGYVQDEDASLPIQPLDLRLGGAALDIFRQSVSNAVDYEQHWTASNLPLIQAWLKAGTSPSSSEGGLKPPTEALITSLLSSTEHRITRQEAKHLSTLLSAKVAQPAIEQLHKDLTTWSERAHTELRDSLDAAFAGAHWKTLSWWKLFWRVDDVSAITSDMVNSRFLQASEDELIYLAGKIEASGVFSQIPSQPSGNEVNGGPTEMKDTHGGASWAYKEVPKEKTLEELAILALPSKPAGDVLAATPLAAPLDGPVAVPAIKPSPWPLHIAITRRHLSASTVPRLQSLAQTLVAQTLATSTLSTAFAGLIYATNLSVGIYEAGAVVALGTVVGMSRMQRRWEGARRWWKGEMREEGRRALVSTEGVVREVLLKASGERPIASDRELGVARDAVSRARRALAQVQELRAERRTQKTEDR